MTRSKISRQALIQKILEKRRVASQEELSRILAEHGYPSNQATISRDVRELGLVKVRGAYALQATLNAPGGSAGPPPPSLPRPGSGNRLLARQRPWSFPASTPQSSGCARATRG